MKYRVLALTLASLALSGCTGPIIMGTDAAIIVATKPGSPPSADTADQIPAHDSWCYTTMGDTECYAHIQDVPPERLVNVDPQSHYPVDLAAYHQALQPPPVAGGPVAEATVVETTTTTSAPSALTPVPPPVPVQQGSLSNSSSKATH